MKVTNDVSSELAPEGTHPARLVQLIDMGTQKPSNPKHKATRKVSLGFEIIDDDLMTGEDEDQHFMAFRRFPLKVSSGSHLGKVLKSWQGVTVKKDEDFDLSELINEPCLITVEHTEGDDGNTYANITAIVSPPKGMKVGKATRDIIELSLDENFDQEAFDSLPDFVQEKIEESPEYEEFGEEKKKKKAKGKARDEEEEDTRSRKKKPATKKTLPKGKSRRR